MNSKESLLDADGLLAEAQARTGLSDWSDDTFPHRFRLAVEAIKRAGMDKAGERAATENCLWLLTSRLQFFEAFKRYPIAEEKIEKPLFVLGEARGGSTFLQALLSVDPNARALRFWEIMHPYPPPGLAGPGDTRRAEADEYWRKINARMPKWLVSHPYNDMLGDGLPECERTWNFDFRVLTSTAWGLVPMHMVTTGLPLDNAAQYRLHKMMLQTCQYARPKKYWVLKGFHSARMRHLFETYPDAQVIWVHREPVEVIASMITFLAELQEMLAGPIDMEAHVKGMIEFGRQNFRTSLENPFVDDPRIHHVRYKDLTADPIGTIRGFYAHAGVPFGQENEDSIRTYLRENKADRYGKFRYSTDTLGVNIAEFSREFDGYRTRFGLDDYAS